MSLQIILWIIIPIGVIILLFICLLSYKFWLGQSTKIKTPNGISSLEQIKLGGIKQWIFIRGVDQKNPVLIFLHGGPGEPALGMSSSRKLDVELIKHFTVVHWDQRGAGKSYSKEIPVDSMTLDQLVEDLNDLIDYLRNRFNSQKVFIIGHSGGTIIGIKTAYKYPEKIYAYVGVAQIINDYEGERISYDFLVEKAEESGDIKKLNAIKAIGLPPYGTPEKHFEKARYIGRYGGFIHDNTLKQMVGIIFNYLTSPEYSLLEGIRTIRGKGLHFTMNAMYEELKNLNFNEEIQSINVPIYFFAGKYDMITPTILVENYYKTLDAVNGKILIIFENSAHFLITEEKEKYEDLLINTVLRECLK
ncbi:MAG: alpha/beta hydrolase [Promethearchaeota archaeon]